MIAMPTITIYICWLCSAAFQIAGQTAELVTIVLDKCRGGHNSGGLDDLATCMDKLRTTAHSALDPAAAQPRDYMADFE